ncbi:MAG: hypothetical protein RMM53_06865, partial [Bacteroidia bacterium]|nr:hypothetical protein [Bacteroidia bacterium]MDW8333920.1 hypothetical protein [Bacteroidia bacterium]
EAKEKIENSAKERAQRGDPPKRIVVPTSVPQTEEEKQVGQEVITIINEAFEEATNSEDLDEEQHSKNILKSVELHYGFSHEERHRLSLEKIINHMHSAVIIRPYSTATDLVSEIPEMSRHFLNRRVQDTADLGDDAPVYLEREDDPQRKIKKMIGVMFHAFVETLGAAHMSGKIYDSSDFEKVFRTFLSAYDPTADPDSKEIKKLKPMFFQIYMKFAE